MPISQAEVGLATWLLSGSTGRATTEWPDAVATLTQEVKNRVDAGIGVVEKGALRIITNYSDASVTCMFENAGLVLYGMDFSAPVPNQKGKPIDYETLGEDIADREMSLGSYHSSDGLVRRCAKAIENLTVQLPSFGSTFSFPQKVGRGEH